MVITSVGFSGIRNISRFLLTKPIKSFLQKRYLNVHEHVSFSILKNGNVMVPDFYVCASHEEVYESAKKLGSRDMVVKAQVLTGGRGKGVWDNGTRGGVKLVTSSDEASNVAAKMIGHTLYTKQTGKRGQICKKVILCQRMYARKEFYLGLTLDRTFRGPVFICSDQGGVNIEDVAKDDPSAIHKEPVDIFDGVSEENCRRIAESMGLLSRVNDLSAVLKNLFAIFTKYDASMIEVNPLAEDTSQDPGRLICLDAKMNFDDNAAYRQEEIFRERDTSQEDPHEIEASTHNLNYITLDGSIGCLVNGAGLAMATMDIITLHGGQPANFLDIGGGATVEQVTHALRIITNDTNVHAILVNIFGGIMRCDVIAEGLITAVESLRLKQPIVCRLQGTNVDDAKALLASSGLRIMAVEDLDEAARMVVKLSSIVLLAKSAKLNVKFEIPY